MRQLAAALVSTSLLAGNRARAGKTREQARGEKSGSKLPHSKASQRMPPGMRSPALPAHVYYFLTVLLFGASRGAPLRGLPRALLFPAGDNAGIM